MGYSRPLSLMPRRAGGHPGHPGWGARPPRRVTSPLLQKGCPTPRRCTTLSQEGYASPQERRPASQEGCPVLLPPGGEPLPQQGFPRPMDGNPCQEGCPSLGGVLPPRCTLAPPGGVPHFPRRGTPAAQKGCPTYQEEVKGVPPPPRRVPRLTPLEGYPGPLAPPGREPTPSRRGAPPSQEEAPMGVMPTGGG